MLNCIEAKSAVSGTQGSDTRVAAIARASPITPEVAELHHLDPITAIGDSLVFGQRALVVVPIRVGGHDSSERLLVGGIQLPGDHELLARLVEKSNMDVESRQRHARLRQIGIERERFPILANGALVWKAARLGPEKVAAREVRIRQVGIEPQRGLDRRIGPCFPLRHGVHIEESPGRRDRDPRMSLRKRRVELHRAFEKRQRVRTSCWPARWEPAAGIPRKSSRFAVGGASINLRSAASTMAPSCCDTCVAISACTVKISSSWRS